MDKFSKVSKLILVSLVSLSLWSCASKNKSYEDGLSPTSDLGAATIGEDSSVSRDYSDSSSSGYTSTDSSYSAVDTSIEDDETPIATTLPQKDETPAPVERPSSFSNDSYSSTPSTDSYNNSYNNSGRSNTYRVKRGDTLMKIAFEHYGSYFKWKEIYRLNRDKMQSPETMPVGITLVLEDVQDVSITRNGTAYEIQPGDTLKTISKKVYGSSANWKQIWKNNPELIKNPKRLFYGFTLYYAPSSGLDSNPRQPSYNDF